MNGIYGKFTEGKDGIKYRSEFEAEFAHKFLHGVYEYVYEKPYDDGTKRKCDFYIESLDLWIECSWNPIVETFMYQKKKGKIFLDPAKATFQKKDDVRRLGGKWGPINRLWYIPESRNTGNRLEQFEEFMFEKDLGKTHSDESHIQPDYEKNMKEKLTDNKDKRIIVVSHKEVSTCNDLWDVMRVVDNSLFMKYFEEDKVDGPLAIQKSKKISKTTHQLQLLLKEYYKLDYEGKQKFDNEVIKRNFGHWAEFLRALELPPVRQVLAKLKNMAENKKKKRKAA